MLIEHSGSLELTLTGENLTSDTLQLYHEGTLYTPLVSTETSATYILGDNGLNKIYLNGKFYTAIQVSGVTVPEGLSSRMQMWMIDSDSASINAEGIYNKETVNAHCINYSQKTTEESHFVLNIFGDEVAPSMDEVAYNNCAFVASADYQTQLRVNVTVTDATKPAYVTYQGFIIAVFNY